MGDETVTVLDLEAGAPRLIIDTGMEVHGLGLDGSVIVVVREGKIISWSLPAVDHVLQPRVNVNDNIRATAFNHPSFPTFAPRPTASVSPDLGHIAIVEGRGYMGSYLHLYDIHTGQCLASVPIRFEASPWFTLDGREIWCVTGRGEAELWGIMEDSDSNAAELEHLESTTHPPDGFPRQPPRGYAATGSRWVLGSSGKRLLWLPPHWRSDGWNWMWGGRFLALIDRELPEPVILELEE